jgi:hypothetical protein
MDYFLDFPLEQAHGVYGLVAVIRFSIVRK